MTCQIRYDKTTFLVQNKLRIIMMVLNEKVFILFKI